MRYLATHGLLLTFLLLGSGALEYFHNWAHEMEDRLDDQAQALAAPRPPAHMHPIPMAPHHEHDENNCEVHAQLHMAVIVISWTALLIRLGIWIAFLSLIAIGLIPRLLPERIDCRGPPVLPFVISF